MSPEFIQEVRRTSSQTTLRAQRIAEKLKERTTPIPPPNEKEEDDS